jgi:hypothetical protein
VLWLAAATKFLFHGRKMNSFPPVIKTDKPAITNLGFGEKHSPDEPPRLATFRLFLPPSLTAHRHGDNAAKRALKTYLHQRIRQRPVAQKPEGMLNSLK